MVCSSTDVFSCFTCSLFTDSLNLTQTPGGYFGPCTVRPNVIFIFCTFQHLSTQEIFNVLVLLSSLNYFYLKQTSCCEVDFYFLCFKSFAFKQKQKKLQNRILGSL